MTRHRHASNQQFKIRAMFFERLEIESSAKKIKKNDYSKAENQKRLFLTIKFVHIFLIRNAIKNDLPKNPVSG